MKRSLLLIFYFIAVTTAAIAQSQTTAFEVGGMKVIFKPTQKKVINIRVYFRGGVTNYPSSQAGIETLALDAVTQCGTEKYPAAVFKDSCDKYDILMNGSSTLDYGYIQVNCINKYFNYAWKLFTEAITNPTFEPRQVELLKAQIAEEAKTYYSNPDNAFYDLQMKNAFAGTPYAISPVGTEESISGISAGDIRDYYKKLLNKNRMFIVVVGNINKEDLYEKILSTFNGMDAKPYTPAELNTPELNDNKLTSKQSVLQINYVSAAMNAPQFSSPYYVPFRLAMSGVGGNLYAYLRTSTGLSYNPNAGVIALRMPFAFMKASSKDPVKVMTGMLAILKATQARGYDDEWLENIKNNYLTRSYMTDQSASQLTNDLGSAEILGNWHFADDLPQLVQMVTVEQMNSALKSFITGVKWTYMGDKTLVDGYSPPVY